MKKYSITTPDELRRLCIRKDWFTCGSNRQYEKLFKANEELAPIEEIATIIWLCSDDEAHSRRDILEELKSAKEEYESSITREEADAFLDEIYEENFE